MYDLVTGGVGQQWDCALLVCFMSVKDSVVFMALFPSPWWVALWAGWLVGWFGWVGGGGWFVVGGWLFISLGQSINARSVLFMVNGWETGTGRRTGWHRLVRGTHSGFLGVCLFYMGTCLSGRQEKNGKVVGCGFACSLGISYVLAQSVSQPVFVVYSISNGRPPSATSYPQLSPSYQVTPTSRVSP